MGNINEKLRTINGAIRQGDLSLVKANLDDDDDALNAEVALGTWLHTAAARGQLEIVKYLMSRGLSINVQSDLSDKKAICNAVAGGHSEIVDYFLSEGADIDVNHPVVNPLFDAILENHIRIAKTLIDTGMDTAVKYTTETMKDMDALDFAKEYGRDEIISMLEEVR